ncbi:uncharacterized protein EAE98_011490 [Botrytis deweyae]|uniref:Uncharacterized protein n=1 Tax=Botrytis deweyae TaxID=2478750 RepID=A0ABQ7I5I3_9HELO|nr:uncharacterized protein EAE98_011490 [Botrytis deweyae]KAF7913465.1 hypothetical protein EAE98_011490 [Botrytis deweyae]
MLRRYISQGNLVSGRQLDHLEEMHGINDTKQTKRPKKIQFPSIFQRLKNAISWNGRHGRQLWKEYPAEPVLNQSTMRALLKVEGDLLRVVFPEDNVPARSQHPKSQAAASTLRPKISPTTQSDIAYEHKVFGPSIAQEKADASAVCRVKLLTANSCDPFTYIKSHETEDKRPELVGDKSVS